MTIGKHGPRSPSATRDVSADSGPPGDQRSTKPTSLADSGPRADRRSTKATSVAELQHADARAGSRPPRGSPRTATAPWCECFAAGSAVGTVGLDGVVAVAAQHRKAGVLREPPVFIGPSAPVIVLAGTGTNDAGVPAAQAQPHPISPIRPRHRRSSGSSRGRGGRSRSAPGAGCPRGSPPTRPRAVPAG